MDLEYELDFSEGFPELRGLKAGDTLRAEQFLLWFAGRDEDEVREAAQELERRGVCLDASGYAPPVKRNAAGQRLALEAELAAAGRLEEGLPEGDLLALTLREYGQEELGSHRAAELWARREEMGMETLFRACLPWVRRAAAEFTGKGVLMQDLLQEGSLALWETFSSAEETDLYEKAMGSIRRAMTRLVTLQAVADHAGARLLEDLHTYGKTVKELQKKLGRTASNEEIAAAMGRAPEQTEALGRLVLEAGRAIKPGVKEETPSPDDNAPVEDTAYFALRSRVEELLSTLPEADRLILTLRFGLDGKNPRSTGEIQEQTGLTETEIQRREAAALAALRARE